MTKRTRSEDSTDADPHGPAHAKARVDAPDTRPSPSRSPSPTDAPPEHTRTTGQTTILSWNVETPVPFLQLPSAKARAATGGGVTAGSDPGLLRALLRRHAFPDFVCLQEVRARHTDKHWIAALRLAANYGAHDTSGPSSGSGSGSRSGASGSTPLGLEREAEPRYTLYHSLSRATRGQRHFGVATFVREPHMVVAAREVDWDAEGRVLILEIRGGWALVNVYALNGSEYMWRDPLGHAAPKTRNERKREFNELLLAECAALRARGLRIVLIGDFNIALAKADCFPRLRTEYPHGLARKEFKEQFIPGLDVVDVFRELCPDKRVYSWFAKGKQQGKDCSRVDYALVESSLRENVVDMVYLENPDDRAHSDHLPLLLTMKDLAGIGQAAAS